MTDPKVTGPPSLTLAAGGAAPLPTSPLPGALRAPSVLQGQLRQEGQAARPVYLLCTKPVPAASHLVSRPRKKGARPASSLVFTEVTKCEHHQRSTAAWLQKRLRDLGGTMSQRGLPLVGGFGWPQDGTAHPERHRESRRFREPLSAGDHLSLTRPWYPSAAKGGAQLTPALSRAPLSACAQEALRLGNGFVEPGAKPGASCPPPLQPRRRRARRGPGATQVCGWGQGRRAARPYLAISPRAPPAAWRPAAALSHGGGRNGRGAPRLI